MEFPEIGNEFSNNEKNKKKPKKLVGFQKFGLSPNVYKGIMKLGYKKPTPIQNKALPVALNGSDIVGMARTGSGKSAAFVIPVLERLKAHSSLIGARGLIVSPTRELAQQLYFFVKKISTFTSLRVCLLQGGDKLEAQFEALQNFPDILIVTPGRLAHLLLEMEKDLTLNRIECLVFDEADRLFEMGFKPQIDLILSKCPESRQTLLFSATLPNQLMEFAKAGLNSPELIRLDVDSSLSPNLRLAFFKVRTEEKIPCFLYLLDEIIPDTQSTVVFVSTRHHVEYLLRLIELSTDIKATVAYGSLDQESREANLQKFRDGKAKVLIVTDVAARGLDIPLLNNVINFDFPANKTVKLFVHRVGRAARQGKSGTAFSFVTSQEVPYLVDVCSFVGIKFKTNSTKGYTLEDMSVENIDLGVFPQDAIQEVAEKFTRLMNSHVDLLSMRKSVDNAYKLYQRSRESASRAAVRRSKELEINEIHPLLKSLTTSNEYLSNLTNQLKSFKPKETIFEVNDKKLKASTQSSAILNLKKKFNTLKSIKEAATELNNEQNTKKKSKSEENDLSDLKHQLIGKSLVKKRKAPLSKAERKRLKQGVSIETIEADRENKAPKEKPSNFRDSTYIDTTVDSSKDIYKNETLALENEVMELIPDDVKAMKEKQKSYKWDKKKKKYIKGNAEDHLKAKRLRNESGKLINLKKRGSLYKKWQKSSKRGFGADGEGEEVEGREVNVRKISKKLKMKAHQEKQERNQKVYDEVITDEKQLRKKRQEKDKIRRMNVKGHKKMVRKERQIKKQNEIKKRIFRR